MKWNVQNVKKINHLHHSRDNVDIVRSAEVCKRLSGIINIDMNGAKNHWSIGKKIENTSENIVNDMVKYIGNKRKKNYVNIVKIIIRKMRPLFVKEVNNGANKILIYGGSVYRECEPNFDSMYYPRIQTIIANVCAVANQIFDFLHSIIKIMMGQNRADRLNSEDMRIIAISELKNILININIRFFVLIAIVADGRIKNVRTHYQLKMI